MSFEFEEPSLQDNASQSRDLTQKSSKISYTREFLLSLSELEICKNLPKGFDRSILSEFEDAAHQRNPVPGSSPLLGFRRGDYSSSPPTRGDSSNYSKGVHGKWGSRSSGQSDKDSDSQSDRDSESGRRQGNPSRRSWQSTDHDGLLGSGSFPRPSGYAAGMMTSKVRGDDHFQLKKSNEPYHPPRPYKAIPHTRKENNDSINDETFGSTDCTSEDRAEEERKRRASFELMRKEQQKVLQEKQKMHVDKEKDTFFKGDPASLGQTIEGRALDRGSELDLSGSQPPSTFDSGNNSFPPHASAPRPLVPPGFASTILEKNSAPKVLSSTHEKIGKQELGEKILHAKPKPVQNGIPDKQDEIQSLREQQLKDDNINASFATKGKMVVNPLSGLEVTNLLYGSSSILKATEALDDGDMIKLATKVTMNDTVGNSNQDKSVSILNKLFGSSLTANTSANIKEPYDCQPDVKQSPDVVQSSKFSHWFLEDEKRQPEHLTSVGPDNLLSLIVGGDKGGVQSSNVEAMQLIPPEPTHHSSERTKRLASSSISSTGTGISEQSCKYNGVEAVPAVLTCEDLEEKILSEYTENRSTLQPSVYDNSAADVEAAQSKASVDSHASLHLLSLLHKGTDLKDSKLSSNVEVGLSDRSLNPEIRNTSNALDKSKEADGPLSNSGKNITLEALFGTAFMKELQSAEAPVSVHRSVAGSTRADNIEPRGLAYHVAHDGSDPATIDENKSNRLNFENGILTSNLEQQTNPGNVENWSGSVAPQINIESMKLRNEGMFKHGAHRLRQNHLPEEESSLLIGDPLNPSKSSYIPGGYLKNDEASSNTSSDIADKLAALSAGYIDERSLRAQDGLHSHRGPYDLTEPERQYHNLYAKASPPQFHSPQMSHGRPLFHPIESHSARMTSQMKFMAPEGINHDGRISNHFPVNMIRPPLHHPNTTLSGFDLPVHHQMLQHMQAPANFPSNVLHEYPRGGPLPPHASNQQNAFMQEPNLLQGFPFGQRQPNVNGLGMQLPAPDVSGGGHHQEALQMLISMEHGANPKPVQAFGISQGIYNHELDMSSRYR